MSKIAKEVYVSGRVQGVGFRWLTQLAAKDLHITGFVENLPDGSVHLVAVGEEEPLKKFLAIVKKSPSPSGRVDHYEEFPVTPVPELTQFRVTG